MKKNILVGAGLVLILGTGGWYVRQPHVSVPNQNTSVVVNNKEVTIHMTENGFTPDKVNVSSGATITFVNDDTYWHWPASDPHPTHTNYPELDPKKPIAPKASWQFTAVRTGSWGIHDHLAPYILGTIVVK